MASFGPARSVAAVRKAWVKAGACVEVTPCWRRAVMRGAISSGEASWKGARFWLSLVGC